MIWYLNMRQTFLCEHVFLCWQCRSSSLPRRVAFARQSKHFSDMLWFESLFVVEAFIRHDSNRQHIFATHKAIGNHTLCQAALCRMLSFDRSATAETCILLGPNNITVYIGSGLQKFIIVIISMPSVAIQIAMGDVLPLVEPWSHREPKQCEGPWSD